MIGGWAEKYRKQGTQEEGLGFAMCQGGVLKEGALKLLR